MTMFSNSQETLLRISQNGELCVIENIIIHLNFKLWVIDKNHDNTNIVTLLVKLYVF
jgi:hypothetical protein